MRWRLLPLSAFADHAANWQALNAARGDSPFLDPAFVTPLLERFAPPGALLATAPGAMAVVERLGRASWRTVQPANGPLGLWVSAPGLRLDEAVAGLLRALPGLPLVFGVTKQDPALLPRPEASATLATMDYLVTGHADTSGPFDAWWSARSRNLRQNIRRQQNKLGRLGIVPRVEVLTAPEAMAAAVADHAALEQSGWKGRGGTAIDVIQAAFYTDVLERFAARGAVQVTRLWFDGALVSSYLDLRHGGASLRLKLAYDEAVAQDLALSPSLLLRETIMRRMCADPAHRRDEFCGGVGWQRQWADGERTLYHVNVYRWAALGSLHRRLRKAPDAPPLAEHRSGG